MSLKKKESIFIPPASVRGGTSEVVEEGPSSYN